MLPVLQIVIVVGRLCCMFAVMYVCLYVTLNLYIINLGYISYVCVFALYNVVTRMKQHKYSQ